jgi:hypothetical protein
MLAWADGSAIFSNGCFGSVGYQAAYGLLAVSLLDHDIWWD